MYVPSEQESRELVADALQEAMEEMSINIYQLHEITAEPIEHIQAILNAEHPISDSLLLTKLENALEVRLTHL